MNNYRVVLKGTKIFIRYSDEQDFLDIDTNLNVNPQNFKNQKVLSSDDGHEIKNMIINDYLGEVIYMVGQAKSIYKSVSVSSLKKYWNQGAAREVGDLFDFFKKADKWLASIKDTKSKQTYKNCKTVLNVAKEFEQHSGLIWDMDIINTAFVLHYYRYLIIERGLFDTTANKHIRTVKQFARETFPEHEFPSISPTMLQHKLVWLNQGELTTLNSLRLEPPYDRILDLFLFLAATGVRYHDSQTFQTSWQTPMADNLAEYMSLYDLKNGYSPLPGVASKILETYGGIPPRVAPTTFLAGIRSILKLVNFSRPVQVYTGKTNVSLPICGAADMELGRQTYIMLLLMKNVPIPTVMQYCGLFNIRTFSKYIDTFNRNKPKPNTFFHF